MPSVYLPVPESDLSIGRVAVLTVVRQLLEITNLNPKTMVVYRGESVAIAQHGSTVDSQDRSSVLASTDMVTVEAVESYTAYGLTATAIARAEVEPVFVDEFLDVMLRPIYSSNNMEITFKFKSKSENLAKRWRDDIRMRVSQMRDINLHKIEYHYSHPLEFMVILAEIHKLREETEGYGDKFEQYLFDNSTTRLTEIANLSGSLVNYAITESGLRVQGLFDFLPEGAPREITKGDEAGTWVTEFIYRFTYDKVVGMSFRYPIMVHNQLLPERFIPKPIDDHNQADLGFTHSGNSFNRLETQNLQNLKAESFVDFAIPANDQFLPNNMFPSMKGVISALCSIDPTDKKYLVDLHELGDVMIDKDVMEFFEKVEWKYLTVPLQSIFNVSIFRHSYLANDRDFFVNNKLQVRSKDELNLRKNHRVILSLCTDIELLPVAALKRMKMFPKAAAKILKAIKITRFKIEALRYKCDLSMFVKDLANVGPTRQQLDDGMVGMMTVQTGYIVSRDGVRGNRLEDAPLQFYRN